MAEFRFRHGIARRQQDATGNATNLQPSNGGSYVDLIVSPDPTVFICAHFDEDYMVAENVSVSKAWGPFISNVDYWLYWDIDFTTGALSRGITELEPIVAPGAPANPLTDQHWYDSAQDVMKVWTGSVWIEKLRVFAAKYRSGASIEDFPLRSQIGKNNVRVHAGTILFDPEGDPIQRFQRNRRGKFITTETPMHSQFNRIGNFRVEAAIVQGEAVEHIPMHYAVAYNDFDKLKLARNTDLVHPAIGVAVEDMFTGEVRSYITKGFITNDADWDWSAFPAQTGIFLGQNGELIATPDPTALTQQLIGYIVNHNTIFVNIDASVLLEPPDNENELALVTDRNTGRRIGRRIPRVLDDLKDVDIDNPQDGDVIIWDATQNMWVLSDCCGQGGGATTLDELTDVSAGSPMEGYVLVYRSGLWIAEPSTGTDEFVKVSANDTTTGHLDQKLVAGTGINLNLLNPGANEQFEIELGASPSVPGYGLFVTDVTAPPSGIVGDYVYAPDTVPANVVITEATSDQEDVRIDFIVEGNQPFYSPTVIVDVGVGDVPGILVQDPEDIRTFHGHAIVQIADGVGPTGRPVLLEASHGATASVLIKRAPIAPEIQTMTFDSTFPMVPADGPSGYPGGFQTTIKSGDVFFVSGTVENSATFVELLSGGASGGVYSTNSAGSNLGAPDSGGVGFKSFTIRFLASSASGVQTATARARNSFGTFGNNFVTTNDVTMDQVQPTINISAVTYPPSQQALKGAEQADVANTASGQDYIYYYEIGGSNLNIANPTTYEPSKAVSRVGGDYVFDADNLGIEVFKTSNGTSTTTTGDINISNIAPTVAITGASSRLISSPGGQNYSITMTFSQRLLSAPTISSSGDPTAGDRGSVTGSGTTWTFTLTVDDADIKDVYNWTVDNVVSLSNVTYNNVTISSGGSYEIGGFTSRRVTVGALEQVVDLGVDMTDPSKIVVKYADTADNLTYRGSNLSNFQKGWSAVDGSQLVFTPGADPFPNYSNYVFQDPSVTPTSWFFITDSDFAGANTTGTLQIEIREDA